MWQIAAHTMKTWDEPKKLVAVICVLCFPPSLCPSNPTPSLLSRKLHIPPPLLTPHHHVPQCLHFPRPTLTNPSCHPPPLLQHLFPALLSPGPTSSATLPTQPTTVAVSPSFLLHPSQLLLASSQFASVTPISSFPSS